MNARRTLTTTRSATSPARASGAAPTAAASEEPSAADSAAVRQELIAAEAYYLAEKRGFAPGAELDDWLTAEAQIEARRREAQPNDPRERSA